MSQNGEASRESMIQLPPHRNFSRQVSLETGFAALNAEAISGNNAAFSPRGGKDRRILFRNGKSMGPTTAVGPGGDGVRKGDYSMFRTKSTLNKQLSMLPVRRESGLDLQNSGGFNEGGGNGGGGVREEYVNQSVPAGRYLAALLGPELDEVKDSEDILLPTDQTWPFLLRFPINSFGICLGLGSQSILWKSISSSPSMSFLHIPPLINTTIWSLALLSLLLISLTYSLKLSFFFHAVRREYFHPVRVNFFFAPWIASIFLVLGSPPSLSPPTPHPALFCALFAPLCLLELKIYGQWLSGGKRRLCKLANPSSHLSVVGNFVGAVLAVRVGWVEAGKLLWAVGIAHYLCVFVTLYQRLPTSQTLPKELHPVYSMFIATPSAASLAWSAIYGDFDAVARTFYFIALFLYISLIVRINFFRGFKFSLAWWSYTFPMTTASMAAIKYAEAVPAILSKGLALGLALISSAIVLSLFISTLLHGFVWRSLFPNDLAIAISRSKNTSSSRKTTSGKDMQPVARSRYDNLRRWTKKSLIPVAVENNSSGHGSDDKRFTI